MTSLLLTSKFYHNNNNNNMIILVCISISIFAYGSCQLQSRSMTTSSICTTTSGPASSNITTFTSLLSASSNEGTSSTTVMEETTARATTATSTLIVPITPTPATTMALSRSKTTEIATIISMSLAPTTLANTSIDDDDLDLPLLPVWISQLSALTVMGTILLLAMCGCATWCCVRVVCQRNVRYRIRRRRDKSLLQYAL